MNDRRSAGYLALVLLFTAMFASMGGPMLAPALPGIRDTYVEVPHIEFWCKKLIAVTSLFSAIGALLFGWISDRYGRHRALLSALLIWGVFGASGLIKQPFWTLFLGRAMLGLSAGGLVTANTTLIAASYAREQQQRMMGLQATFSSLGVVVALVLGGLLANIHWQWVFAIFLLAFVIYPFAVAIPTPVSHEPVKESGSFGGVIWSRGLLLFLFGFVIMVGFNVVPTQMPFYLQEHGAHSPRAIGFLVAILPAASAVGGRLYASWSPRINPWRFFILIGVIMWTGFHAMGLWPGAINRALALVFIGLGAGLARPHVSIALLRYIPKEAQGRALGIMATSLMLGAFISPSVMEPILTRGGYIAMLRTAGWLMLVAALMVGVTEWWRYRQNIKEAE